MASLPPSPPIEQVVNYDPSAMDTAGRVLRAQGEAITALSAEFASDRWHNGPASLFCHALTLMQATIRKGGKIVISGMGKSHKIGGKLVATLHSFGIPAATLHPSEALHGDVGMVTSTDIAVLISASGKSPELQALMRHLPENMPTICLTCVEHSPLAEACTGVIVAPVAPHNREQALYGLPAPTITTTLCLAIGDAMCIALHECLVQDEKRRRANFQRWHPGGAIGLANGMPASTSDELAVVPWDAVPKLVGPLGQCASAQIWRAVALAPCIICDDFIYRSSDVITALESGIPLDQLYGHNINLAPPSRGHGLCIFRDETNQPTGLVWE